MLEDNANQKLHVKEGLWRQPLWLYLIIFCSCQCYIDTQFLLPTIEVSMQLFPWIWKTEKTLQLPLFVLSVKRLKRLCNFHYCYEFPLSLSKERKMNLKKKKITMINCYCRRINVYAISIAMNFLMPLSPKKKKNLQLLILSHSQKKKTLSKVELTLN